MSEFPPANDYDQRDTALRQGEPNSYIQDPLQAEYMGAAAADHMDLSLELHALSQEQRDRIKSGNETNPMAAVGAQMNFEQGREAAHLAMKDADAAAKTYSIRRDVAELRRNSDES